MGSAARVRLVAAGAALAVLAACGSTVSDASTSASEVHDGLGPIAHGEERVGPTSPDGAGTAGGATAASEQRGGSAAADARAVPATPGDVVDAPPPGASGWGYTADEIFIGYLTWKDVTRVGGTVGYAVDYGDSDAQARAVVKDINDRGGIAGRKVTLVLYDYESGDVLSNRAGGDQKACAEFTEDNQTFAVVAVTGILSEVLPDCLAERGTILIANTNIAYPQQDFERLAPHFYANASPTLERFIPAWLERAKAIGYFSPWDTTQGKPGAAPVKVGVLGDSTPLGQQITKIIQEELTRLGYPPAATVETSSGLDANGASAAVLRFKAEGVTHVVAGVLHLLLFPQSAESQRYRPRYAVSTFHAPILIEEAAPREQLAGALGAGFYPTSDVSTANDPGDVSPFEAHCREIQRDAGQDTEQREAFNFMVKACDGFAMLREAVALGGLSVDGFQRGLAQIDTMPPAGTFVISHAGGQASGVAAVRDLGYELECGCFKYLSGDNHGM